MAATSLREPTEPTPSQALAVPTYSAVAKAQTTYWAGRAETLSTVTEAETTYWAGRAETLSTVTEAETTYWAGTAATSCTTGRTWAARRTPSLAGTAATSWP